MYGVFTCTYIGPYTQMKEACTSYDLHCGCFAFCSGIFDDFIPLSRTSLTSKLEAAAKKLGGGFKYFRFSPLLWEMIQFD